MALLEFHMKLVKSLGNDDIVNRNLTWSHYVNVFPPIVLLPQDYRGLA